MIGGTECPNCGVLNVLTRDAENTPPSHAQARELHFCGACGHDLTGNLLQKFEPDADRRETRPITREQAREIRDQATVETIDFGGITNLEELTVLLDRARERGREHVQVENLRAIELGGAKSKPEIMEEAIQRVMPVGREGGVIGQHVLVVEVTYPNGTAALMLGTSPGMEGAPWRSIGLLEHGKNLVSGRAGNELEDPNG